ncbi:MAG: hypothetical protein QOD64_2174 [Verrucomicrobiota bacterium]|jgi:hypothetical protein
MIGFLVVAASVVVTGYGVASSLWKRLAAEEDPPGIFERAASGVIAGVALWMAANWILAIAHLLTFTSLMIVTVAFGAAAAATLWRHRGAFHLPVFRGVSLAMLPVVLWVVFILWRGAIVPTLSHDALSYHLPKAVMIMRAHGYQTFQAADQRIVTLPANYELLLADVLILSGTDRLTEWLSTIAYLAMLILTGAFAERWWRAGWPASVPAVLAVAATPLFLLHSGADKNDLMTAFFCGTTLLWGARWFARGGRMPLLLAITSAALAIGTKPNGAAVAVCLAPFMLVRLVRAWRSTTYRDIAATLAGGALAFLLLGGAFYIFAAASRVSPIGVQLGQRSGDRTETVTYGDWQNLWQVPYLALAEPFSRNDSAVWVPWRHAWWFWPRYEIYFSNAGPLFTVLVLLLPIAIAKLRRRGDGAATSERNVASIAAAIALIIVLPAAMRPLGFFAGAFIRYCAFVIPIVVCWTVVPACQYLGAAERHHRLAVIVTAGLVLFFAVEAVDNAVNDNFAPLDYVLRMRADPGSRKIYFGALRAASVVDGIAGPNDTVAVDGAFGTWVYPAYGSHLTRNVVYLTRQSTPDSIPLSARWVMIDRLWNVTWSNPNFTDMGKFWEYIGHGTPSAEDVRLFSLLLHDARFRLIFYQPRGNQAVFWRVGPLSPRRTQRGP